MAGPGYYLPASWYFNRCRVVLQDMIQPYRYPDDTLDFCINTGIRELTRLRPDLFLDAKYSQPLRKGDISAGYENVGVGPSNSQQKVGIPFQYATQLIWFATGMAQILDVADAQDQRAQAFLAKFQQHLLTLSAA